MNATRRISGKSLRSGERLAQQLHQQGITNPQVLSVIACTPRHLFVPEILAHKAYDNTALPIGQGQTISQPYIVAKMSELLLADNAPQNSVLEIGTGSGYQTSILAQLFDQVYSVERIKSLQFQAKRRLQKLDLHNVQMKHGDGWKGWKNKAPFKAIIVTAAASEIPQALVEQLADGGKLIIPVGEAQQTLKLVERHGDSIQVKNITAVRFVPLVAGELL
ncbi:protein-L-isoaspartate(D-aspartate) O-methyltransferase [Thalassotalea ponticola]|uniref:protein-L-isoaspartate(D-aspartate) O-methyltransferase n=1 Tax=Thalassotalea ponticola TaxID=1523392 RepID=UPI0025B2868C|nr:protein-L-isoaspartate(D-aspartate) O-methyltransferase [Thalassotalea ponticola]MDN3652136.1 protein-L-isoaspartate(D-aspartate) O-methyltransferase [Thalassotalea ponticola]